ncbi:polyamine aminopropyltransferase [Clostridium sp. 2-1]|jgi:spermidine synthase|uniref:Polyamine aminopropyltransferase n=2 Tax=Clostridium beijerinckii TaxID=1520 RepID=SPEE_CLOB8|nr:MULTISPECIES: polyamine aminopropyltransferase [Clostridium]A6M1N9.1 RecName: Full=Polyamine aminopropyltransferase; AltName: Full=Putrescine aminopropyltransferase; Short=PAPT; AltName: Full=Spermidine synthase; Short=SPDS; Short=SPDSY [Clostridium beijerinckii NCIMB 8052]ABR36519.1 spermidine synthase [Clostridium beijerinckii NCIMB 8052]AIU00576.1 spermidine synthase [Clostridium beijerinckii ATCC 35702]AVK48378.1 spermidine synthase [Clostridium sp. MF28]MBE6091109.1 polyamine aminoprop
MELWYTEQHTENVRFSIKVEKEIHTEKTEFQRIDVLEAKEFGRFFTLDGLMMVTEKDEFIYHDMIVHVPMATNPNIKNVLVIGAGDGGTIRELTRYSTVEKIDMVEIDKRVVDICREYFPLTSCKLDDKRVNVFYEDGLKFIRDKEDEYDLIIVDSTDPFGPGEGLFTKEFYGNCYKALREDGILVNQHESPYYDNDAAAMKEAHEKITKFFPIIRVYQAHIPTYPSGHWLFGFASKKYHPIKDFDAEAWNKLGIKTKYYNTDLHVGCFALPTYVRDMLNGLTD